MPAWLQCGAGILLFASLPAAAAPYRCEQDARCKSLRAFFERYESPLVTHSADFLQAADRHRLDWRLLPAIAMVESSGGKHCEGFNPFGWDGGKARFRSFPHGIRRVAGRFARSRIYRGKTPREILTRYNPGQEAYAPKVVAFMEELSPEPVL